MLIGDLIKKTGLSKDTIRYYEKVGLIKVGRKERRENNYKEYSNEVLTKLLYVTRLKLFGFTLQEINDVIDIIVSESNICVDILDKVNGKIGLVEQKILELEQIKNRLSNIRDNCTGNCTIDDILP